MELKKTILSKCGETLFPICELLFLLGMYGTSLVAQTVKNLPVMQETGVRSQGQEDPLEKGMATHSSILAWRIPWTEEPGGLQSMGSESDTTERLLLLHRCRPRGQVETKYYSQKQTCSSQTLLTSR